MVSALLPTVRDSAVNLLAPVPGAGEGAEAGIYSAGMTLLEITYELQGALNHNDLRQLREFANTYGLRRFRVDAAHNRLTLEYDASRLKETQVTNVLRRGRIPILRRVEP